MPLSLSTDYFERGAFAHARPGELFAHYTCLTCGYQSVTWAGFKLHRTDPDCMAVTTERLLGQAPDWALGRMPDADRAALTALLAQLPDDA